MRGFLGGVFYCLLMGIIVTWIMVIHRLWLTAIALLFIDFLVYAYLKQVNKLEIFWPSVLVAIASVFVILSIFRAFTIFYQTFILDQF